MERVTLDRLTKRAARSQDVFLAHDLVEGARPDAVGEGGACTRRACGDALKYAIITPREAIPEETRRRLFAILGRYLGASA